MQILGILVIVVGVVLILVGKNVAGYLPPDYQDGEDGFLQLVQSMGQQLRRAGLVFLAAGAVCIVAGFLT